MRIREAHGTSTLHVGLGLVLGVAAILALAGVGLASHGPGSLVVDPDDPDAHDSVQAAIDDAAHDDTVLVRPGVYEEAVRIDVEGLTLCSSPAGSLACERDASMVRIDGGDAPAVQIASDEVTVAALGLESRAEHVVEAAEVASPRLEDAQIRQRAGLRVQPGASSLLPLAPPAGPVQTLHATVAGAGSAGIHLANVQDPVVKGTTVRGAAVGVSLTDAVGGLLVDNHVSGSPLDTQGAPTVGVLLAKTEPGPTGQHLSSGQTLEDVGVGLKIVGVQGVRSEADAFEGTHRAAIEVAVGGEDERHDPSGLVVREADFASEGVPLRLDGSLQDTVVDARLNDWGVCQDILVEQRYQDQGEGNEMLQKPYRC